MRRSVLGTILVLAACTAPASGPPGLDLANWDIVDLTHPFDARTIYWPTAPSTFALDTLSFGMTDGGWFYAANAYSAPDHGGTHLDAPMHFAEGQAAADEIPLERLVAPAVVIDIDSTRTA